MGMSVAEFLRRKNEIVKAVTGVILVPEDQIVDIPEDKREPLDDYRSIKLPKYRFLGAEFCLYCQLYSDNDCNNCPMSKAGNRCSLYRGNTWEVVNRLWKEKSTEKDWKKLKDLMMEYNKQFENSERVL